MPQPQPSTWSFDQKPRADGGHQGKGAISSNLTRSRGTYPSSAALAGMKPLSPKAWLSLGGGMSLSLYVPDCALPAGCPLRHHLHCHLSWLLAGHSGQGPSSSGLPSMAQYLGASARATDSPRGESRSRPWGTSAPPASVAPAGSALPSLHTWSSVGHTAPTHFPGAKTGWSTRELGGALR